MKRFARLPALCIACATALAILVLASGCIFVKS